MKLKYRLGIRYEDTRLCNLSIKVLVAHVESPRCTLNVVFPGHFSSG